MSCESPTHNSFKTLIHFLAKSWEKSVGTFNALGAVGSLFTGYWVSLPTPWDFWKISISVASFVISMIFLILAPYVSYKLQNTFSFYDEKISDLNDVIANYEGARAADIDNMRPIFREMGIRFLRENDLYNDHIRISLYQHEKRERCFTLLERVSKNPVLSEKGRPSYPDDQGFISEVWKKGNSHVVISQANEEAWVKRQLRDYNVPLKVGEKIKMKSRTLVGISLKDISHKSVGLIIIESLNRHAIPAEVLDQLEQHEVYKQLCFMLSVTPHLPKDYFAR